MWTPDDVAHVFDHCAWTLFQIGAAWVGFMVLIDMFFGGEEK